MEPVLTPEEMRAADDAAIRAGTSGYELMDRAAYACAVVALRMLGGGYGRRAVIVAGKGNNGGDGIAAAGHLARAGVHVDTFLLAEPRGDPAAHLSGARRTGARFEAWSEDGFACAARRADLVVDAIFGTGVSGPASGVAAVAIGAVASCGRPVLAVDVPSGPAIRADVTLAVQSLKSGHLAASGRVDVADVGIALPPWRIGVPHASDVAPLLPRRAPDAHKYQVGAVLLIAGSPGMTGAAVLAARAAIASGAGLVYLAVPAASLPAVETAVTEAVKVALSDGGSELDEPLRRVRAIAIGPGIGRGPRATALVGRVLREPIPVVVDADGLAVLDPAQLADRSHATVLTPHAGEFAHIAGSARSAGRAGTTGVAAAAHERLEAARETAAKLGAIVHLKGLRAVTAHPGGRAVVNPTGGAALATGGTGDVLTGTIASLIAQGMDSFDAAWAGAFVHGVAGRSTASAGDLAAALPTALARVRSARVPSGAIRTVLEQ